MKRVLEKGFVFLVLIMFLIVLVSTGFVFAQSTDVKKIEIKDSTFKILETGKYQFGNREFLLPAKTNVEIKGKKVIFKVPNGNKISKSKKLETGDRDLEFSYESDGMLELPNGEVVRGGGENIGGGTKIGYDSGGFFVSGDLFVQKNGNDEFKLKNYGKTYLAMSEGDLTNKRNEVFIGKDKLILSNPTSLGSVVSFSKENRFGIAVDNEHSTYAQAVLGKIIVNANEGKLAEIRFSGNSIVDLNKKSFFAHNNRLYVDTKKGMIGGVEHAENDAAVQLSLINKNEDKLLDSNIISNGRNQYAQVADRELKSALEYYKAEGGFYVATSVAFNQLTPEAQGFYDGLSKEKQKEIGDAILKLDSGQGEALVQRVINEYRIEEERLRQSPVKASVKISSRGHFGSGTIIGVDKEGRPIILTAGHLTGARTPGTKKTITFPDETTTTATVLAGQGSWGASSGNDLSIMRIDKPMKDIAYVPVALSSHNIDTKKPVLRIGYPGGNNMKKVSVAIIRFSETGRTQTRGGLNGGNSGGGMFQNGRLLGVISIDMESATGYANLNLMRKFLTDQGYGYLIKIMVVFF